MSTLDAHRAAIVTALLTVPDIGVVNDHEPFAKSQTDFQRLYLWTPSGGPQQLRGWYVRRTATRETSLGVGRVLNVFTWRIRGFMALQEPSSELVFDALVEAARLVFRADETLGGVAQPGPLNTTTGLQVVDSSPVMFTGVLCHSATLQLQTYAYLNPGE